MFVPIKKPENFFLWITPRIRFLFDLNFRTMHSPLIRKIISQNTLKITFSTFIFIGLSCPFSEVRNKRKRPSILAYCKNQGAPLLRYTLGELTEPRIAYWGERKQGRPASGVLSRGKLAALVSSILSNLFSRKSPNGDNLKRFSVVGGKFILSYTAQKPLNHRKNHRC